jgi:hypothetical protein
MSPFRPNSATDALWPTRRPENAGAAKQREQLTHRPLPYEHWEPRLPAMKRRWPPSGLDIQASAPHKEAAIQLAVNDPPNNSQSNMLVRAD